MRSSLQVALDVVGRAAWVVDAWGRVLCANTLAKELAEHPEPPRVWLSPRQTEVLGHIVDCTNNDIAKALGLSKKTVEGHVAQLMRKAGVRRRTALVAFYYARTIPPNPLPRLSGTESFPPVDPPPLARNAARATLRPAMTAQRHAPLRIVAAAARAKPGGTR